jgi:hypothetical protein
VDARWVLALKVRHSLEGGKAALLTPAKRRDLVAAAVAAGLREFDANLVIAVVQDAARRGELGDSAKALAAMGPSLAMVGGWPRKRGSRATVVVVLVTLAASGAFFAAMVVWTLAER